MQKADWKCFADIFRQIHVLKAKELPDLNLSLASESNLN